MAIGHFDRLTPWYQRAVAASIPGGGVDQFTERLVRNTDSYGLGNRDTDPNEDTATESDTISVVPGWEGDAAISLSRAVAVAHDGDSAYADADPDPRDGHGDSRRSVRLAARD